MSRAPQGRSQTRASARGPSGRSGARHPVLTAGSAISSPRHPHNRPRTAVDLSTSVHHTHPIPQLITRFHTPYPCSLSTPKPLATGVSEERSKISCSSHTEPAVGSLGPSSRVRVHAPRRRPPSDSPPWGTRPIVGIRSWGACGRGEPMESANAGGWHHDLTIRTTGGAVFLVLCGDQHPCCFSPSASSRHCPPSGSPAGSRDSGPAVVKRPSCARLSMGTSASCTVTARRPRDAPGP